MRVCDNKAERTIRAPFSETRLVRLERLVSSYLSLEKGCKPVSRHKNTRSMREGDPRQEISVYLVLNSDQQAPCPQALLHSLSLDSQTRLKTED
jgi:hypothetical protein